MKPIQVYNRVFNLLKKNPSIRHGAYHQLTVNQLNFLKGIESASSYSENTFEFLNLKKDFGNKIDWNFKGHGKLWTYNLNYFEYLNQQGISRESGLSLIKEYISLHKLLNDGLEPYPISLRTINWIQFLSFHKISDKEIDSFVYKQIILLNSNLEYHLLGNHLLENGFALLYGAYYFDDRKLYNRAKRILTKELKEQILTDGAHFELSPMYHSIMLLRVLDSYNLVSNNDQFGKELKELFENIAQKMLSWLINMTFESGLLPLMNDAAYKIAPNTEKLNDYARRLRINPIENTSLKESGYRKFKTPKFEFIADLGNIGPDYQPGHAHADTFNFELHINGRPVIVDTGTSTYEINETRYYERSTAAHNTVVIEGKNSSEVWSGHRVARRARVTVLEETPNMISASHNGYKQLKNIHQRTFELTDDQLVISDKINSIGTAFLHFHPSEHIVLNENAIVGIDFTINFQGADAIKSFESNYAPEFNKLIKRQSIRIEFSKQLTTIIK